MDIISIAEKNISRRLKILSEFTSTKGNGVTRLPFSNEGKMAAEYLKSEMENINLKAHIDVVGNVSGRLEATISNAKTIIIGSHYDTVKNGGEYDGIAGVVCAIEIADFINRNCKNRKYALEIVAFNDEEGMMFGSGCLGSKALLGQVDEDYINNLKDENGISIKEWIENWGSNPKDIPSLKLDINNIRGFFEIHIEQGPILDEEKKEIGIVNCIVGLLRCMVTVEGRADHAGTTPMDMRKDAISISSKVISKLDEIAKEENNDSVATCGFIRAYPNAMNVIARKVEFTMDIRSSKNESIENMKDKIWKLLKIYTNEVNATYNIDIKLRQNPVYMDKNLVGSLLNKSKKYKYKEMVSGAAHDAMIFADKVPTAMVFVPSLNGRSHCKEEDTKYSHLAKAVEITYNTILDMMIKGE